MGQHRIILLSAFSLAGALICAEVVVLGAIARAPTDLFNIGTGAGIGFFALGTLFASLSLNYITRKLNLRSIAVGSFLLVYILTFYLLLLQPDHPSAFSQYIVALIYSIAYTLLNYCVGVTLYDISGSTRTLRAKQMAIPFFAAQAAMPALTSWLLSTSGYKFLILLIAALFSIPLAHILRITKHPEIPFESSSFSITRRDILAAVLMCTTLTALVLNWYFSSLLTLLVNKDSSIWIIGWALSMLNVAGMLGSSWISTKSLSNRAQLRALATLAVLGIPAFITFHALYSPSPEMSFLTLVIFLGLGVLAGFSASLAASLKYTHVEKKGYSAYHRLTIIWTTIATLFGSIMGSALSQHSGWRISILVCFIIAFSIIAFSSLLQTLRRADTTIRI